MTTQTESDSYYSILGLHKRATQDEIKRAYRSLSQVYHPDKQQGSGRQHHASQLFTKILEAYEVLSDPAKRDIYDVYGKEGLAAGMEVGPHLDKEELRKMWEQYQRNGHAPGGAADDIGTSYEATYGILVDGRDCVRYYPAEHAYDLSPPTIKTMSINSTMSLTLSNRDVGWVGGEMRVSNKGGDGGFVCGYKRVLTAFDEINTTATVGLKTLCQVSCRRVLGPHDTAVVGLLWNPPAGLGVSFAWERLLAARVRASWSCNLMSNGIGVMALALGYATRRLRTSIQATIASNGVGLQLKGSYATRKQHVARVAVGLSPIGQFVSAGGTVQLTRLVGCGLTSSVGPTVFELPMLLSPDPNAQLAALALALPTALVLATKTLLYDPVVHHMRRRTAASVAKQRAAELWQARKEALVAQELLLPVALRTARKQQQAKGLVVLCATYGSKEPDTDYLPNYQPATPRDVGTEDASQVVEPPPAWLDVTVALQYAVQDNQLSIASGVPLMHRMGFYDPSPEAEKLLRVEYMHRGQFFKAEAKDGEGLQLPGVGEAIGNTTRASSLLSALQREP